MLTNFVEFAASFAGLLETAVPRTSSVPGRIVACRIAACGISIDAGGAETPDRY